ncbi:Hypothetical protein CAP_0188 [Chondromyces apiculatus DSM 436]|uniref:Uncharacterized protein n=2 Tax=Chondromyces apiculatus TaxID=51 RepID=A0A017TF39_9BACT|nr:Hypothetical protein CAP_0188 [Chondromyces apiculatus DSM 436]
MLKTKQAALDEITVYEQRVTKAKTAWKNRDHDRFAPVREVLRNMCAGNSRCMYCEDSAADEIEHVRPKSLYPE